MKIALVNSIMPFIRGGAEIVVDELERELIKRGNDVDKFGIPYSYDLEYKLIELISVSQMLRFDEYDIVIAFKFPAYCVYHKNKVLWIFHQFRQVYELWNIKYGFSDDKKSRAIKYIIENCDNKFINQAKKIFAISESAKRLKLYNNINAEIMHCPQKDYETYYFKELGNYIICPARINNIKRQHLAIEALRYTKSDVKVVIAGVIESDDYRIEIEKTIKKYNLSEKVLIHNRWISDQEKKDMLAGSLAVFYFAFQEDSCGFTTMEGFYSSKPVITLTDTGGICDFVTHNETGFIVEPNPMKIAEAMDFLFNNRNIALEMGKKALDYIINKNITWEETINRLLK